ncbi:ThuA domain-containing protein [Glycomyces xiaoerkulensis]|uniref:ThuA domain-containing protein n=1 Tax=Glycomyces xiaoerkulensis TaxID=2038139 RepID=UPI000C25849A|nr:ThuA domain-containing protein [Glycomyces xiaoerkulensis]
MSNPLRRCLIVLLAFATVFAPAAAAHAADGPRVLVVTAGTGDAEVADYAVERLGMEARRWNFELVEGGPGDLDDLSGIDVVMFLNTSGDILGPDRQETLRSFVEGGGGLVGTHSAAVTEPDWPWWDETLGASAIDPPTDPASKQNLSIASESPITSGIDEDLELTERWYYFDPQPSESDAQVLAQMDSEDPAAWTGPDHNVFYSVPGGAHDTWGERDFLQLIRQAIWWAAGESREMVQYTGDAAPTWPYTLTFVVFVAAVAGGGSIAVWRLDSAEPPEDPDRGAAPEPA